MGGTQIGASDDWKKVNKKALSCQDCDLYIRGTQTVFGEGSLSADFMIVGEQPGDKEDLAGRPFVGRAGDVLNKALEAAGIDRTETYLTNAVKHFKWVPGRGKSRLHQKPNREEMNACSQWLAAEVKIVKPKILIALGVTASTAIFGKAPKINQMRGQLVPTIFGFGQNDVHLWGIVTWHPSSILRMKEEKERHERLSEIVDDLKLAKAKLQSMK